MRVAVFGAGGMLGRAILRHLRHKDGVRVFGYARTTGTARAPTAEPAAHAEMFALPSLTSVSALQEQLARSKPEAIINCIGRRGRPSTNDAVADMVLANSRWPHQIAALAASVDARLIHFSTDGVFSGNKGGYQESDIPDAEDHYGRSKLLGEPEGKHCLTIRTSMIGHDHAESDQLVDWFLRQSGEIRGYENVVFSGLTTVEIAKVLGDILLPRSDMSGVWHLASHPISKYALLAQLAAQYQAAVELKPWPAPVSNRSLDGSRFNAATGYTPPTWPNLIAELWQSHQETQGGKR
jgi:dTDP-4-dehydrorhamnose reductase